MKSITGSNLVRSSDPLSVHYFGELTNEIILDIFDTVEGLLRTGVASQARRRVLNSLIEVLQNMNNYYVKNKLEKSYVKILVFQEGEHIYIVVENEILKKDIEDLTRILNSIELESMEKVSEKIRHKRFFTQLENKSAGTGLLEVVHNAGGKINYSFKSLKGYNSMFKIEVKINLK